LTTEAFFTFMLGGKFTDKLILIGGKVGMENVDLEEFYRQTQATRMRAAELYQQARKSLVQQQELLVTACEELYDALESLEVAGEALRQKHNNFTTFHELVELERQHFQNLFEYAPDAYLVTDMAGTIRQANCAAVKLLNTKQHFLLGKPLVVFVAANQRRAFRCKLNQLYQVNQVQEWEVPLLPRNGAAINVALAVSIIRNQQDVPTALGWLSTQRAIAPQLVPSHGSDMEVVVK